MIRSIDDLWLSAYLISCGAELSGVQVLPLGSGPRMRAVFELAGVSESAIESYANGNPQVEIHALRTALNQLRDLMYAELEKRNGNGSIKQMPNGGERRNARLGGRRRDHEIHQRRNR